MTIKNIFFLVALSVVVSGCAASGARFSANEDIDTTDHAVIYIFRTYNFVGGAGSPNLYLDGERIGKLKTGGYLPILVPSGEHDVVLGKLNNDSPNWAPENATYKVKVKPGEEYFLRMEIDFGAVTPIVIPIGPTPFVGFGGKAGITITTLSKEEALPEIQKTNLSN